MCSQQLWRTGSSLGSDTRYRPSVQRATAGSQAGAAGKGWKVDSEEGVIQTPARRTQDTVTGGVRQLCGTIYDSLLQILTTLQGTYCTGSTVHLLWGPPQRPSAPASGPSQLPPHPAPLRRNTLATRQAADTRHRARASLQGSHALCGPSEPAFLWVEPTLRNGLHRDSDQP
nr:uncharacterized protein LOC111771350 isoform X2 [Equus caballus]